jgi:ribosomal protein S18 acetylase RimI-like enzyme
MSPSTIRRTNHDDIEKIVDIHLNAFQGFFLSFLGAPFLTVLYRSILADPSGIVFVAEEEGKLAGFVAGTTQLPGLYKRLLKKHWWQFGWASIGPLIRQPSSLRRLLRGLSAPAVELPVRNCGTLMSIAVDPDCQGKGVGKKLVEVFLAEAKTRRLEAVELTTDAKDNDPTNKFYRSLGFQLHHDYTTPEGRTMNDYIIYLAGS